MRSTILVAALFLGGMSGAWALPADSFVAPKGKVSIKSPKNGATVTSPVKVIMVSTVKLRPAGEDVNDHSTGHHHLIIDGNEKGVPMGELIPNDEKHMHFGKGQTEAEVKLTPGPHTLTIQLADGAHRSYGPELAKTIHIVVK